MAKCKLNAYEYIRSSFSPQVAVLPSEDVENTCLRNNLRFVELLQPFTYLQKDVYLTDPSGLSVSQRNLKIVFEDMNHRPVQPTFGKKMLSEIVLNTPADQDTSRKQCTGKGLDVELSLQLSTPWFEAWRELFLQIQYPSDHEFTKHYVACIIVISSGSDNPLDQLHRLSQYQHQQQHQNASKFPKWFSPNILKFYLLLHDVQHGNIEKANSVYKDMQNSYGNSHCYMLQINSGQPNQSDPSKSDLWQKHVQQKKYFECLIAGNLDTSPGNRTPREDMAGFPARVSEGDSCESPDQIPHPLSPVPSFPDDKNGVFEPSTPSDVPLLLNPESPACRAAVIAPTIYGACLTDEDIDRVRQFATDFCTTALVPHVERQIKYLTDVVANRPRSESLLSATRRWLGGSKPPSGTVTNSVIYTSEATELQTRRLGDLCFMFGHYELAYNTYITAKNDFKSDQAWLYFAGAQEMAALAGFMHTGADYPKRYFEGSLHTYLNVCKVYNFAIRLTLLSTEVLKHFNDYSDAAMTFLKMTSEESDLLSALMLEQAAHCFINMKLAFPRKYAFHVTLAGHRYGKAGQKNHSLRSYNQALQVYRDRCWVLAEDHIYFTMSKQALYLKERQQSVDAIMCLINQVFKNTSSQQSVSQQLAYFKEFLGIVRDFDHASAADNNERPLLHLSIPSVDPNSTKVLVGSPAPDHPLREGWIQVSGYSFADEEHREPRWLALEKDLTSTVYGPKMMFKPRLHRLSRTTPNTAAAEVPINEFIQFEFAVRNPLLIGITVLDILPIYDYFDESDNPIAEETCLLCESVSGFNMPPESQDFIRLRMRPTRLGKFIVKGIRFGISLTADMVSAVSAQKPIVVMGQQLFAIRGPRLNASLADKRSVTYGKDLRLTARVIEEMPMLSVSLKEPPALMCCGEIFPVEAVFKNVGRLALHNLHYASSDPRAICFKSHSQDNSPILEPFVMLSHSDSAICGTKSRSEKIPLEKDCLESGQTFQGTFWLHTPPTSGAFDLELLFYFQNAVQSPDRYRLLRHLSNIYLEKCLVLNVTSRVSNKSALSDNSRHAQFSNVIVHAKNNADPESQFSPDNVALISISVNSPSWKLLRGTDPLVALSIGTKESTRLRLECMHLGRQEETQQKGNVTLAMSSINISQSQASIGCWKEFAIRERIKLPHLLAEPPPPNKAADFVPPPPTQYQIDTENMSKASNLDLVLSLLWKGNRGSEQIWGQHSVHLPRLGDSAQIPSAPDAKSLSAGSKDVKFVRIIPQEEPKQRSKLVEFSDLEIANVVKSSIQFPSLVEHDFDKLPLCTFSYTYTLINCTACRLEAVVRFCSKESRKQSASRIPSQQCNWNILPVANTVKKMTLAPWQYQSISVKSIVPFAGGYLIGATSIEIRTSEESTQAWIRKRDDSYNHILITNTAAKS